MWDTVFILFWRFDFLYFLALCQPSSWLLYHLVNIGWFRGGRWVTEPRPQGLRLRTGSPPSRACAKESRTLQQKLFHFWFVMWIVDKHSKNTHPGFSDPWTCPAPSSLSEDCCENIAKDWLLTGQEHACSRITRLFVCLSPCREWPHTQENGCYCPPVITNKREIKIQILISWVNTWAARPPPPTRCQSRAGGCPWKTVRGGCPWKQLPGGCPWKTITTYSVFLFRSGDFVVIFIGPKRILLPLQIEWNPLLQYCPPRSLT